MKPHSLHPQVRIGHVHLKVAELERSLAFYRDVLGIPLEGDDHWAEAAFAGGTRFALHEAHDGIGDLSSGTVNVSLEVEDVDLAAARLREHGVEIGETMREEWGTAADVVDPDGYTITLFQRAG